MNTCDNCTMRFDGHEGLVMVQKGLKVAELCPACLEGVQVAKLVLKRTGIGTTFVYDQFSPIEMQKKAFGKAG